MVLLRVRCPIMGMAYDGRSMARRQCAAVHANLNVCMHTLSMVQSDTWRSGECHIHQRSAISKLPCAHRHMTNCICILKFGRPAYLEHVTEVCDVGPGVLQKSKFVSSSLHIPLHSGHCCDAGRQVGACLGQLLFCCRLRRLQRDIIFLLGSEVILRGSAQAPDSRGHKVTVFSVCNCNNP